MPILRLEEGDHLALRALRWTHHVEVFGKAEAATVLAFVDAEFADHDGRAYHLTSDDGGVVGGFRLHAFRPRAIRVHDLALRAESQGRGLAAPLMEHLFQAAAKLLRGQPGIHDGSLWTWPYPEDAPFPAFLLRRGWEANPAAPAAFGSVSALVHKVYAEAGAAPLVKAHHAIPAALPDYACRELDILTPAQREVVLGGLRAKLGAHAHTGHLSYRFDLCPICKDMGSTEQDDGPCRRCYLRLGCTAPFRTGAREEQAAGVAYFQAMFDYLMRKA